MNGYEFGATINRNPLKPKDLINGSDRGLGLALRPDVSRVKRNR
jgi:hypothetical protein